MSSAARIQANRNNAKLSTGPRTAEGKARSARNALKHGLAAESLVVAGAEDPDAFEAFRRDWLADAKPVGLIETSLAENACLAVWKLRRAARQEAAESSFVARRAADEYDRTHRERASNLLRRLLNDPLDRCEVYQWRDPLVRRRVEAAEAEDFAALAAELDATVHGIDMKLECWEKLASLLREEKFWHYDSRIQALRLLGRRPEDIMSDPIAQDLMLSCSVLHPKPWSLVDDVLQSTMTAHGKPVYAVRVALMEERRPATREEAMARIWKICTTEYDRLVALKETRLGPRAETERAEASARALLTDGPTAALRMRYEAAAERTLHRSLAELARLRKARLAADPADIDDLEDDPEPDEAPPPPSEPPPPPADDPPPPPEVVVESGVASTSSGSAAAPEPSRNEPNAGPADPSGSAHATGSPDASRADNRPL